MKRRYRVRIDLAKLRDLLPVAGVRPVFPELRTYLELNGFTRRPDGSWECDEEALRAVPHACLSEQAEVP